MALRDGQDIIIGDTQQIGIFLANVGVPLTAQAQAVIVEVLSESSGVFQQQTVTANKSNIDGFYKISSASLSAIVTTEDVYSIALGGIGVDNVFLGRFRGVFRSSIDEIDDRSQEFNDDVLQNINELKNSMENKLDGSESKFEVFSSRISDMVTDVDKNISDLSEIIKRPGG